MEKLTLNNGVEMPLLGLGTFQMTDLAECEAAVSTALDLGYRLIDTASAYSNEAAVGQAIAQSGLPREELFITSKLWIQDASYQRASAAFEKSLDNLGLDYLDLYLIHQPYNDVFGAWRALEELYAAGKIRAIGVSNFYPSRMVDFFMNTETKPAINQIELHPFFQQQQQREIAANFGFTIQSWAPLAEGKNCFFSNPLLFEIGEKYQKTPAQIALRWQIQSGVPVIPKSVKPNHLQENYEIFDFQLTRAELMQIKQLDQNHSLFNEKTNPKVARNMNSWKIS
ncbi:aldo/keto reductase [Enterococcus sp. LJL120]